MPYYVNHASGQRVEIVVERWGRRYPGLTVTVAVLLGLAGAWLGLFVGASIGHLLTDASLPLVVLALAGAAAGWVAAAWGIYRGLSGPRRK